MLKKWCTFLFAVLFVCPLGIGVSAAGEARVEGTAVEAKPGQSIVIPVTISGNPGLMGFKLQLDYPAGILKSPAAHRGAVTSAGMFNDSINSQTNGSFTVVWTNAQNVTTDGPLCVLDFTVSGSAAPGEYSIKITASQPDTFNEAWEDVALDCRAISIRVTGEAATTTTSAAATTAPADEATTAPAVTTTRQQTETPTTKAGQTGAPLAQGLDLRGIDSEYLVTAVEGAFAQLGVKSIGLLPPAQQEAFVGLVLAKLNAYGAGTVAEPEQSAGETLNQLEAAYREAKADLYVDTVLGTVDGGKITGAVEEALSGLGAESMDELTDEQKQKFTEDVAARLKAYHTGEEANLDGLSEEEAFEAVSDLYEQAKAEQSAGEKQDSRLPVIIGIPAGVILLAGGAALLIYRKRKKNMSDRREKNT